jgi:dTMP kinase
MKKGKFIVVEGGEGAGKGTQIKKLKEDFSDLIVVTHEPGGSPYAEEIRNLILKSPNAGQADAKTLFALFWAARADHLKNTIVPALLAGKMVISDRFDSSTFAYQIFGQEAKELETFFWQMRDFYLVDTKPDFYIYFDVTVEEGLRRKYGQGEDEVNHFEERKVDFHRRMREGYTEFFKSQPHTIIDANLPSDEVYSLFKAEFSKHL